MELNTAYIIQAIIGFILLIASLGVVLSKKPVYSSLFFLLTLLMLAGLYLQLSAEFIAVIQILVYAGAILVLFMFVIVLFQDAHLQINKYVRQSSNVLLAFAGVALAVSFLFYGYHLTDIESTSHPLDRSFGSAEAIGKLLYVDFFIPFESIILLFLVAIIGTHYIAKKVK